MLVNNAGILRVKSFAKMALVGLMPTLSIEGARHDIRVSAVVPQSGAAQGTHEVAQATNGQRQQSTGLVGAPPIMAG